MNDGIRMVKWVNRREGGRQNMARKVSTEGFSQKSCGSLTV